MNYPAVLYYESHPVRKEEYHVFLTFPDLKDAGFSSCFTVGSSREDAVNASREILGFAREEAAERGILLPPPTPITNVILDRGYKTQPFRVIVENICL